MQYETIILELLSRIKKLEDEVEKLKADIAAQNHVPIEETMEENVEMHTNSSGNNYTKLNDQMINLCYEYGKKAYDRTGSNLWDMADSVAAQSGMNRSSAFIYICVVKNMLDGDVFKRAINAKAMRIYFNRFLKEYGKEGLAKALNATRQHITYRRSLNHPVDSIEALCSEYEKKL